LNDPENKGINPIEVAGGRLAALSAYYILSNKAVSDTLDRFPVYRDKKRLAELLTE